MKMSKLSGVIGDLLGLVSGPYGLVWNLAHKQSQKEVAMLAERRRNFVVPENLPQELLEILADKWGLPVKRFKPSARIVSGLRVPPGDVHSTTEWLERYYFARFEMEDIEADLTVSDYLAHLTQCIRAAHAKVGE